MRRYATYFDRHYLPRALALFASLDAHSRPWEAVVLCLDEEAERGVKALGRSNLHPLRLEELEAAEPRLLEAKKDRSRIEYYFTCGPAFLEQTLTQLSEEECLVYLDADLYFFSSPEPLEREMQGHSIGIMEHRFSPRNQASLAFGRFNVGWLCFRHDVSSLACLHWWKERCLEWCFDRFEGERYADQKYLDRWPELFQGVHVIGHRGANVGPWNVDHLGVELRQGQLVAGGEPLIFYHFQGLQQYGSWLFDFNVSNFGVRCWGALRWGVYLPYLRTVLRLSGGAALTGIRAPLPALGVRCWEALRWGVYLPYLRTVLRLSGGAALTGVRAPLPALGLRTLKRLLWNGGYALNMLGRLW